MKKKMSKKVAAEAKEANRFAEDIGKMDEWQKEQDASDGFIKQLVPIKKPAAKPWYQFW